MLSQKYPSILKSIHPSSVRTSKEKKKNLAVQHNTTSTNKPDGGKKKSYNQSNPTQPNPTILSKRYYYIDCSYIFISIMASRELTPIPTGATTGTGTAATNGSNTSTPLMPSIVQISRPFFTHKEISYLHNQTIPESLKPHYTNIKNNVFQFLFQIIKQLKFPLRVLATAMNYYQRYYLFNKFETNNNSGGGGNGGATFDFSDDPHTIAITCLFLASKVEDCIKRLKDIQTIANKLRDQNIDENKIIESSGLSYIDHQRKHILSIEYKLLQIIKFDFNNGPITIRTSVDNLIIQFCKNMKINYKLSMLAWLINFDIMSTPLSLVVPPHCIALAIIIISLNLNPIEIKLNREPQEEEEEEGNYLSAQEILQCLDSDDFKCPEVLVNEAIIYILDYYIHQYQISILNVYLPLIDSESGKEQGYKFMKLKSEFNEIKIMDETSCSKLLNETDEYLNKWDYTISSKGSTRFMLSNKRRRFNKELEK